MPSLRLFFAIETPSEIKAHIAAIRDRLKASNADVKWESDEKLHSTLKFLGKTDDELLPEIVSYSRGSARDIGPLLLKYRHVGCFPNHREPKIIWIGIEDMKANLSSLQNRIESDLFKLGFRTEERQFHPHVTIGRVKSNSNVKGLLRMMESATFESQPVEIREIALIKSELTQAGSIYSIVEKISLGT